MLVMSQSVLMIQITHINQHCKLESSHNARKAPLISSQHSPKSKVLAFQLGKNTNKPQG